MYNTTPRRRLARMIHAICLTALLSCLKHKKLKYQNKKLPKEKGSFLF